MYPLHDCYRGSCCFRCFPTTALAQDEWSPGSALKCDYDGQRVQLPYNELAAISGPASPEDLPSGYELSFIVLLKRLPSLQEKYDKYVDEVTDRRVPPEDRLSYEEKIARFGPSEADVRELSRWLRSGGFEIAGVTPDNIMIDVKGTGAAFGETFRGGLAKMEVGGKTKVVMISAASVPECFSGIVDGLVGLGGFLRVNRL